MKAKEKILYILRANKAKLTRLGVKAVGLFGSYLYGEQSKDSDIDLLIDFELDQENFDNYMAVYDLFETVFKGNKIDVVTKSGLSPHIGQKILNEVLYA